jgi:hypothetical protein
MGYAIVSRHHNNSTSVFVMPRARLATVTVADSFVLRSLLQSTVHDPGAEPRTSRPLGATRDARRRRDGREVGRRWPA